MSWLYRRNIRRNLINTSNQQQFFFKWLKECNKGLKVRVVRDRGAPGSDQLIWQTCGNECLAISQYTVYTKTNKGLSSSTSLVKFGIRASKLPHNTGIRDPTNHRWIFAELRYVNCVSILTRFLYIDLWRFEKN